jgi:hypothetical protein
MTTHVSTATGREGGKHGTFADWWGLLLLPFYICRKAVSIRYRAKRWRWYDTNGRLDLISTLLYLFVLGKEWVDDVLFLAYLDCLWGSLVLRIVKVSTFLAMCRKAVVLPTLCSLRRLFEAAC